jgi:preprotein translocase subunit SecG
METVIIVIHLMVIVALVAVVLMQRSEGGALGIGGGGGNFMSTRGQGNVLTRSTAILAAIFFATSIGMTILARYHEKPGAILDNAATQQPATPAAPAEGGATAPAADSNKTILDQIQNLGKEPPPTLPSSGAGTATTPATDAAGVPTAPAAPAAETPTAPAPADAGTSPATTPETPQPPAAQ